MGTIWHGFAGGTEAGRETMASVRQGTDRWKLSTEFVVSSLARYTNGMLP